MTSGDVLDFVNLVFLLAAGLVDQGRVMDVVSCHFPGREPVTTGEADVVAVHLPLLDGNLVLFLGDGWTRLPPEVPEPEV